ncbi:MAG: hypothetical protein M3Q57_05195, partial [Pseudomonadota bacterium]|nr:hypothetical protein [Pseudomonadota bacterium]
MVADRDELEQQAADGPVRVTRRRTIIWRRTQWALIALVLIVLAAAVAIWFARVPIANDIIARELEKRGVTATYSLDRIGLRTQRISNL